jgi:hypothetical protein
MLFDFIYYAFQALKRGEHITSVADKAEDLRDQVIDQRWINFWPFKLALLIAELLSLLQFSGPKIQSNGNTN